MERLNDLLKILNDIKMKKSILQNLVILSFAFCALFLVGNNVMADETIKKDIDQIDNSCCIGSTFQITSIEGGWKCLNDKGNSCCPIC
jgi:hypothetical protein